MRPEVGEIITSVGDIINLEALHVQEADSVFHLIGVLEEQLFTKQGHSFVPALPIYENQKLGIGEKEVTKNRVRIALYEEIIREAIDKVDELISATEKASAFGKTIANDILKKPGESAEVVVDKLTQLLALLQSYLDLFQEWEVGTSSEAPMSRENAVQKINGIEKHLNEILIGQEEVVRLVLTALFTGEHILLESDSGMGKTTLAKSLGDTLGLKFARIQCTPDLMATDVLGFSVYGAGNGKITSEFKKGPIFTNILLVDEINRTTPKTQSALLEAMEEGQVTNGNVRQLPKPFFVIATQNSHGSVGTFPLPEAQLDRFGFVATMDLPDVSVLSKIMTETLVGKKSKQHEQLINVKDVLAIQKTIENIPIPTGVVDYASRILVNAHPEKTNIESVRRYVRISASPRGEQAILRGAKVSALLNNRTTVSFEDVENFIRPALRHRISLNLEGSTSRNVSVETIIDDIIAVTKK